MAKDPSPLPIDELLPEVVSLLRERRRLVLEAPPGSGKTTRVPVALANSTLTATGEPETTSKVVVVEPRRLAARAAATRVAAEQNQALGGDEVGYQVRFERRATDRTRLVFVTPGILLAWLLRDPMLEGVGIVVFDEFHERGLDNDFLYAFCVHLQKWVRPEMGICVLSATLSGERVADHLGAALLRGGGRRYPVHVEYLERPQEAPVWHSVAGAAQRLIREAKTAGAVLCFLPGVGEIRRARDLLSERVEVPVYELYGAASLERQAAALRGPRRRVVLATNVAESSVTVEDVVAVVDCGTHRQLRYDPGSGLDHLRIERISKASAEQRAGRAGRTAEGLCLRLWTRAEHAVRVDYPTPEIERVDLLPLVLRSEVMGEQPEDLPWLDRPPSGRIAAARRELGLLGLLQDGRATDLGRSVASIALHPRLAVLLLACAAQGHVEVGARAAALLAERDLLGRPGLDRALQAPAVRCDLELRLDLLSGGHTEHGAMVGRGFSSRRRSVLRTARELERSARRALSASGGRETTSLLDVAATEDARVALGRALVAAFPERVARRARDAPGWRARMVGGRGLQPGSSRVRDAELFVALRAGGSGSDAALHLASSIETEWLEERHLSIEETLDLSASGRVVACERTLFLDLELERREREAQDGERVAEVLALAAASDADFQALFEAGEVGRFLERVRCLNEWCPELDLPTATASDLERWTAAACFGARFLKEVRRAPLLEIVRGEWSYSQLSELDRLVPESLALPSGRRARIRYQSGQAPVLAAKIQDFFGWRDVPRIARGRIQLLLHLLAPNDRPQQITRDLEGFWKGSYREVRKELAGRYPKWHWPEDPSTIGD